MSSKIGKRQQKRGRFDASGTVTSPAFRRKLEALPNSTGGFSDFSVAPESSATRRGDFEDAAAAFKARALAFVSLRSTADEHRAMNGVLEALAALAAGERETRRLFFDQREKSTGDGEKRRLQNAPPAVAANQDATREPIEPAYSLCLDCVLDVLFLPNSRPLHRAIVTAPRAFPPRARSDAEKALVGALGDRVAAAREPLSSLEKKETASGHGLGAARLRVLGVVFSVASCQPQTAADRRVVRAVAVDAAALIGEGVLAMIQETDTGRRVPPAEMETCQEAISVAYALLQRHPGVFLGKQFDENDDDDDDDDDVKKKRADDGDVSETRCLRAACSLIASLYRALQGSALSREAAVAAGVTVAAAVGAGVTDPRRHAAALADAFAEREPSTSGEPSTSSSADAWCRANGVAPAPMEALALATETVTKETATATRKVTRTVTSEINNNTKQHKDIMTFRDLSDRMTPFGRLCAARGVLTAASAEALSFPLEVPAEACEVGRAWEGDEGEENKEKKKKKPWTLLTSYLFPYICASLERPGDSHHKYHAAAALRAALVRVKALAVAAGRGPREKKEKEELKTPAELKKKFSLDDVFPPSSRDRVCDILWANWEDPLSQTVKETHLSFDTLLDVEEARAEEGQVCHLGSARTAFLEDAARSLLKKDVSVKGRYAPLAMVARRLGARRLLALAPDLLTETLRAMRDDSVCTAAGALVAAVAQSLLAETVDGDAAEKEAEKEAETASRRFDEGSRSAKLRRAGKDEGTVAAAGSAAALASWRAWWVGPLAEALLSPGRERAGAGTYALPAFLRLDGASVVPLLARIREDPTLRANAAPAENTEENENDATETHASRRVSAVAAAVVATLRSARALGLLDPDDPSRVSRRVAEAAARTFAWETTSGPDDDDGKTNVPTEETTLRTHSNSVVSYGVDASLLLAAATRRDARSRRDALDLLCADGKRASLPGALERKVLRSAIPTHLRDADPAFRSALVSSTTRLLGRIKAGCGRAAVFVRARPELARAFRETHDRITPYSTPLPKEASSETEVKEKFSKTENLPQETRGARCFGAHAKGARAVDDDEAARLIANASACVEFTEWLVKTLMRSAYPGAPYERKQTALDLLLAVAETFGVQGPESSSAASSARASVGNREDMEDSLEDMESDALAFAERLASRLEASPYATHCLGSDVVTCLLGAAVDSWDKLRVGAFRLLSKHPAPLAGVERPEAVAALFAWALALSRSPRVRESDAAALLLRLLFRKYALDGGWTVTLTPEVVATPPRESESESVADSQRLASARTKKKSEKARRARTARLLGTMCDLIEHECAKAERDLLAACRQSLAHGALLATRYALEEIDFSFDYDDSDDDSDDDDDDDGDGDVPRTSPRRLVQASSARLLRLTERVTAVALRSISAPDGANVGAAAADIAPDRWGGGSGQGAAAARAAALATYAGVGGTTAGDDFKMNYAHYDSDDAEETVAADADESSGVSLAPRAQVIVTACWLTMKEVSLVIGELARRVDFDSDAAALDPEQLRDAGNRLLTTLLTLKHNGAIEKTLVGLTCLGERLLRSPDARLSAQPREWLETLFQRTQRPGQDVRDLIRRSAGIPFGFMAVFLAEPRGVPRTLLHEALEKLLNLANDDGEHVRRGEVARGQSQGVHVPQVHAFNVLRVAFADKELSTETVGFAARGLTAAIKGFSSPHWEVRNGATLTFAALLTKVVGYKNTANPAAGGASRRAVAGDEFFRRFPATHPFLLAELTEAAERLESQTDAAVHPALYPILALLSRLRPSSGAPARESARSSKDAKANKDDPPDGDDGDRREIEGSKAGAEADLDLDPAAFAPAVRRCARGRVHAVRAAAARALAPLIRAQDVARALAETFRDAAAFGDDWTSSVSPPPGTSRPSSRARRPRLGYNAAHGALLCAAELLGAEGPAEAGTAAHAMAAVETAAEGLVRCSYLVDPEASPVAAAAAAWALCAHETLRLARLTRTRLERSNVRERANAATNTEANSEASVVEISTSPEEMSRFFSASRRLTRLARAACDVPASALGFVAASGGGDAARRAARAGVSVAPGDVEWFKRAARLRCVAALDTRGFGVRVGSDGASGEASSEEEEEEVCFGDETLTTRSSFQTYAGAYDDDDDADSETYDDVSDSYETKKRQRNDAFRAFVTTLAPSVPYESRASALRALRDAGASRVFHSLGPARFRALRRFVAETLLPVETRHACARRALETLEQWTGFSGEGNHFEEALDLSPELWRAVEKRAGADANERVRCAATRALGKLAGARVRRRERRFFQEDVKKTSEEEAYDARCCASLVALVKAGSAPERPLDVRRAAARALANSRILGLRDYPKPGVSAVSRSPKKKEAADEDADASAALDASLDGGGNRRKPLSPLRAACLVAWTAAFELMEDEDEPTRDIAAVACARAAGADEGAQTEATLRASFAAAAASFAGASAFEDACHAFVSGGFWDEKNPGSERDEGVSRETHTIEKPLRDAVNETKGVRRLFDREADNHHAEGLLLAQLAARAVAEVPGTVTKPFAAARLMGAARAVAAAARTLASTHATSAFEATRVATVSANDASGVTPDLSSHKPSDDEASGAFPGWAGGATNHGAAFAVVNRACLALWAYARAAGAEARADARVVLEKERVAATFEAARLGPAAAAAWRAAEAAVSGNGTPDALGGAFRTYDPCFLLR